MKGWRDHEEIILWTLLGVLIALFILSLAYSGG